MAMIGTHVRTLDDKCRLAIPKAFRDVFCTDVATTATVVIAPETEQALALFSEAQFQQRAEDVRSCAPNSGDARVYLRLYFSQAESVEIDKQGRIRLPERLMEFAGIQQEVVLLGVNDRVEIWDRVRWDRFMAEHASSFDRIAQRF